MSTWNTIVNAVYRDEWQLVENAVKFRADDSNDAARALAYEVANRLHHNRENCMRETVDWLLRQPYINRAIFAESVAIDCLKQTGPLHQRTFQQVIEHTSPSWRQVMSDRLAISEDLPDFRPLGCHIQ